MTVLGAASGYATRKQLARALDNVPDIPKLVDGLVELDLLLVRGSAKERADRALEATWTWGPSARFFHNWTQSVPYEEELAIQLASMVAVASQFSITSPTH